MGESGAKNFFQKIGESRTKNAPLKKMGESGSAK
jgi:hypothetical protein